MSASATIVSAGDAPYFDLLEGLVRSLRQGTLSRTLTVAILDLGLTPGQRDWLRDHGATLAEPGWDVAFPGRERVPGYYRAMTARPHLPRYFPGHLTYLWIDADAWVQDDSVIELFLRGARGGKLAIVPEIDRGYWTIHKPPKLWGQNQKAFAWAYGARAGYRLGRNAILNSGAFALAGDAPHWRLWAEAHARALNRRAWRQAPGVGNLSFINAEQTALNYVVFAAGAAATFLPAYCNWFCGKGTPMYDPQAQRVIEPHEPHRPLGIIHLAGKGMKDRVWQLATPAGGSFATKLTFAALHPAA